MIKWKACEPSYHNLNQPGMIDYVMLLSRLISWGGLLFSAGFWIACENEGEMILGFMGPLAQRGSDVEVPTMDDRQEIDLKSSVPVKRQYVQV